MGVMAGWTIDKPYVGLPAILVVNRRIKPRSRAVQLRNTNLLGMGEVLYNLLATDPFGAVTAQTDTLLPELTTLPLIPCP